MFGALAITMIAWASVSWSDDRIGLGAGIRLIWQSLFAVLMIMAFGYVDAVLYAHNQWLSLSWFGALLTFFGILWLANLYNFMDGMDGLAASQTIVAALTFAIWFWQYGDQSIALICLVLASSCYGFLLWNWHPAKIFMGDVGSITIGALFATVMIIGATRYDFTIVSSILLFGVFVADASVTLLRRLVNGEKIWQAHRSHYYQRLALAGISHKKIVLAEIILMLICSLIATTTLLYRDTIPVAILVEAIVLALAMAVVTRIETSKQKP
jgi:Fuc2NAc and GlcNAc transferase